MRRLFILFFTITALSASAAWRVPITNFTAESSNSGRQNWDIMQRGDGWIYFANNGGLLEYNGRDWVLRPLVNRSVVRSVASAANGDIYVGGRGEIGRFRADSDGRLSYTNLVDSLPAEFRSFNEVWGIFPIKEHIYFQLRRSIYTLDNHGDFGMVQSNGLILASCSINNSLYFATTEGLYVMGNNEPIAINFIGDLPLKDIAAMSPYGNGQILIATASHALYLYSNGNVAKFSTDGDSLLIDNQVYSLDVGDSHIACGTVKGGVITMRIDGSQAEQNDIKSGLNNNTVLSVRFDSNNNLWCGLDNGIDHLILNSPIRYAELNREYRFSGYCTLQDDKYLYMGTNQGLVRAHQVDNSQPFLRAHSSSELVDNSDGQVWQIQKIDNRIYCCHNRGLFLVESNSKGASLSPIYTDDGVWNIVAIEANRFLLCTYEGVVRADRSRDGHYTFTHIKGFDESVRNMEYYAPLRLGFFVSERGLERVQFDQQFETLQNDVLYGDTSFGTKLLKIGSKNLVYTHDALFEIDDSGSIEVTHQFDHLFDIGRSYSMITVDQQRNIWYISGNQLTRRRYNTHTDSFDPQSDVIINEHNFFISGFTQMTPLDNRYYIINGVDGFSIVDSEWSPTEQRSIKPIVVGLFSTNNRDSLLLSSAYGVERKRIKLPYASNSIRFVFGGSSITEHGVEYSCLLEGADHKWSEWNDHNIKEYTNIFEGNYNFRLRIRDSYGNIEESSLALTITPPWLRTKLMYLLYISLFVAANFYVWNRRSRYHADRRRLVELQSERQIEQQKRQYESRAMEQENKIIKLKNEKLESEIVAKSAELSNLLLNKLEKNDIITRVKTDLDKIKSEVLSKQYSNIMRRIATLNHHLDDKLIDNVDWSAFEDNFNITNNNFVQRISEHYSWMNLNERKLCIYIKMGLQNKEIAPLLNLSVRGVEMLRYRIRKKMELDRNENLYEFFQKIS